MKNELLQQYDAWSPRWTAALEALQVDLATLMQEHQVQLHSITGRIKTLESFKQKVLRPDRIFHEVWEVTDVLALRVITYFEDTIEEIGALIESHFDLDLANSENKLYHKDHQRFGYRSLHYVCHVPSTFGLPSKARFEIQIRTVLQHAWAEIEHDLGYKTSEEIPGMIRRRFSQVAGLLEVADREFVSIRQDLAGYERQLKENALASSETPLDGLSLKTLIDHPTIKMVDRMIAELLQRPLSETAFFPDYLLRVLQSAQVVTVPQILQLTEKVHRELPQFLASYAQFAHSIWQLDLGAQESVARGYSLLFIAHLHILKSKGLLLDRLNRLAEFYVQIDYPTDPRQAHEVARLLMEQLKKQGFSLND